MPDPEPASPDRRESDRMAALQVLRILRERATTYALAGTAIAVIAVILGTLLVCVQVYDGITLDNIQRAHRENVAIWALDAMPFLFGLWGQYANLRMAREAGSLMQSGTEQLRQELEDAQYTASAKTDYFARMSHELRTPLNAIIGMSDLLVAAENPERRQHQAQIIRESATSLLTLINDVLDFSRIEAGHIEIDSVEFDLHEHLNGAAGLMEQQALNKGLRLLCLIPRKAPRHVAGDPGRLRQVVINLVGNAVKFTDHGEVVLSLHDWTTTDKGNDRITIEVADSGIGIAQRDQALLFEPYRQVGRRQRGGTGLGLSITRELVHAMGGEITVESTPGKGSVFSFTIEVQPVTAPVAASSREIDLRGRRVLLADADEELRATLAGQLRALGISVSMAGDGVEAMQAALRAAQAERPFDLLLADMFLPHLSGEELGRRLKSRPQTRDLCIAIMTTAGARGDAKRMNEAGFAGYLTRPLPPEHLQELMQALLATRGLGESERRRRGLITRFSIGGEAASSLPVLVVDDSAVNREITVSQLARMGLPASEAASGTEALATLEEHEYAAILLDLNLPDLGGDAVIECIRDSEGASRHIPILVLTAGLNDSERERCERAGADAVLIKPIATGALREALAPWLEPPGAGAGGETDSAGHDEPPAHTQTVTPVLARLFLREAGKRLEAMHAALARDPPALPPVAAEAHGLKGASQHLPADALTRSAARLEESARNGNEEAVRAEMETLEQEWVQLRERLEFITGRT